MPFVRYLIVVLFLAMQGCNPGASTTDSSFAPPDFALQISTTSRGINQDPLEQTSQYILLNDRSLRVATGAGATGDFFPQLTRKLSPSEYEEVYQIVRQHKLLRFRSNTDSSWPAIYHVQITANGRTHRYMTRTRRSPGTRELVGELMKLSSGRGG